jgi:hypothetical protein
MATRHLAPTTIERDPRTASAAAAFAFAYFVETAPGEYAPTTDRAAATHVLDIDGDELTITPIADASNPARISKHGDTYYVYGF